MLGGLASIIEPRVTGYVYRIQRRLLAGLFNAGVDSRVIVSMERLIKCKD